MLRTFFEKLPEPLMTIALYGSFIEAAVIDDPDEKIDKLKALVASMPPVNKVVLGYMLSFLRRVTELSAKNKLDAYSLAAIFGPIILRGKREARADEVHWITVVVSFLIENYQSILLLGVSPASTPTQTRRATSDSLSMPSTSITISSASTPASATPSTPVTTARRSSTVEPPTTLLETNSSSSLLTVPTTSSGGGTAGKVEGSKLTDSDAKPKRRKSIPDFSVFFNKDKKEDDEDKKKKKEEKQKLKEEKAKEKEEKAKEKDDKKLKSSKGEIEAAKPTIIPELQVSQTSLVVPVNSVPSDKTPREIKEDKKTPREPKEEKKTPRDQQISEEKTSPTITHISTAPAATYSPPSVPKTEIPPEGSKM